MPTDVNKVLKTMLKTEVRRYEVLSSEPEVLCEKDVRRNFAKFTGKHLSQSLCFNKVAGVSIIY